VRGISLTEGLVVIGPTRCGKSTLLRALTRPDSPAPEGQALIFFDSKAEYGPWCNRRADGLADLKARGGELFRRGLRLQFIPRGDRRAEFLGLVALVNCLTQTTILADDLDVYCSAARSQEQAAVQELVDLGRARANALWGLVHRPAHVARYVTEPARLVGAPPLETVTADWWTKRFPGVNLPWRDCREYEFLLFDGDGPDAVLYVGGLDARPAVDGFLWARECTDQALTSPAGLPTLSPSAGANAGGAK
jgi:energy-coupling factor transporter ATP-binding protein EcfA2